MIHFLFVKTNNSICSNQIKLSSKFIFFIFFIQLNTLLIIQIILILLYFQIYYYLTFLLKILLIQ